MQVAGPSLGRITLIYLGFYLGMAVLMNVIIWAAESFFDYVIEANAVGFLPLILGAMMAGQHYGTKTGAKPPAAYAWKAGLLFTLVSFAVSVLVLYAIAVALGYDVGALVAGALAEMGGDGALIAGLIGGVVALIWVLQRFIFSMGAGQGAKQAAMRAK
jgi:hypothetical protein